MNTTSNKKKTLKLEQSETNRKTEVICYASDFDTAPPELKLKNFGPLASVATSADGKITLGVAVGPRRCVTDQPLAKAGVIWVMHERVQLCLGPQTECALLREGPGASRINNILRVHRHTILNEEEATKTFDEVGQRSLGRLF